MTIHLEAGSIIVGVDGSPDADRALHWATAQAGLERRPLAVVAVAGLDQVPTVAWANAAGTLVVPPAEVSERVQAAADEAAARARLLRPGLAVSAYAVEGDPRDVLADLSRGAYLVVVGSRGRGVLRTRLLGSVSTAVARHAEAPVVVCRPDSPGAVRHGVLVGADCTPEGQAVVEFAFRQAALRGLPLTVLHAYHYAIAGVNGPDLVPATEQWLESERLLVSESVAGFAEKFPDVHVDVQLARGFAHECLSVASEQWHLIVVGRHPTDSVARMLSSTVATAVVERAGTTVAVVPIAAAG